MQLRNRVAVQGENPGKGVFAVRQTSCSSSMLVKSPGMDTHRGPVWETKLIKTLNILRFSGPAADSANHTGSFLLHAVSTSCKGYSRGSPRALHAAASSSINNTLPHPGQPLIAVVYFPKVPLQQFPLRHGKDRLCVNHEDEH